MPNPRTKCRWPCQPPCAACPATAPAGIAAKLPRTALPWKAPPWTAPTLPLRKAPALALWKAPTLPPWKAAAPPPWKPPPPPPWPPPPPPPWPPKAIAPVVIVVARATAIAPAISCFLIITSFTSHQPSIGQTTASEANWLRPGRPKPAQLFVMNERLFDACAALARTVSSLSTNARTSCVAVGGLRLPGSRTYAGQDRGRIGVAELVVLPFDFDTQTVVLERPLEHLPNPDLVSRIWKRPAEKRLDGIAQIVKRGLGRRQSDPGELRLEFA